MARSSKNRSRSYKRSPSPGYGASHRYIEGPVDYPGNESYPGVEAYLLAESYPGAEVYPGAESYPHVSEVASQYTAPLGSSKGKNYAPAGLERTLYRGSDMDRAHRYVSTSNSTFISTERAGDFHVDRDAAYFTYDKTYARKCAPSDGAVIEQRVPREFLMDSYRFDETPNDDWCEFVGSNRRREPAPGKLRPIQKRNIIEGPIAESSTHKFRSRPVPREAFHPVFQDDEYVQQVAFLGDALEELPTYPKRIVSRSPPKRRQ